MSAFRLRLSRLQRALCVLVAAAMTLAPVLSAAASSHEAAHSSQGEHHFHDAEAGHTQGGPDDASDAGDLLHGLTHAVHACAHALAILAGATAAPLVAERASEPGVAVAAPPDAPRTHPFRPPIV